MVPPTLGTSMGDMSAEAARASFLSLSCIVSAMSASYLGVSALLYVSDKSEGRIDEISAENKLRG